MKHSLRMSEPAESTINVEPQSMVTCTECKGTDILFDPEMGEKVCKGCGVGLVEISPVPTNQ
jgi:ribosomal protein S27E